MIRLSSVVLFLFVAVIASAQEPLRVSPLVSFDFGSPLFINRAQGVLNPFGITSDGNSSSESYGIGADAVLPDLLGHLGLVGRLEGIYNTGSFTFTSQPYTVSGIDRKVLFEVSALWDAEPLEIRFGPWISQSIHSNVYENDPNGNPVAVSNPSSPPTHFGLSAGIGWRIPDFPLQPEITSRFDFTEAADAGFNALSIGISLSYLFEQDQQKHPKLSSDSSSPSSLIPHPSPFPPAASSVPSAARVQFFVNGTKLSGPVPLERQELHVTEYTLADSNGEPRTRTSQWIEESFHLPDLSVRCGAMGSLTLSNGSRMFAEVPTGAADTTIHLGDLPEWNEELARMNIDSTNRIIAQFESVSGKSVIALWRDTLLLPPIDTNSHPIATASKNEFQFRIPTRMERTKEGRLAVDSMLHAARELSARTVSIHNNPSDLSSDHAALLERIHNAFDTPDKETPDTSISDAILIIIQE